MGVEMPFEVIEEYPADSARDLAVGKPEILLRPFGKTRIEGRVVSGAGGAQPGVKGLGVRGISDRRVEVGAAAEPALGGGQEAGVHMHRGDMRIGHVRDQADAGGEEARVGFGAVDLAREFLRERAADGRDIDPDLFEHAAVHLAADSAAAGFAGRIVAVPRRERERGVAPGFALDRLELRADAVAQLLEPIARRLLLVVEFDHRAALNKPGAGPRPAFAATSRSGAAPRPCLRATG